MPELTTLVYGFVQAPVTVRPVKLFLPRNAPTEQRRVLRVSHSPDHPIKVTNVSSDNPAIKVLLLPVENDAATNAKTDFQVEVTLPPGDRITAGTEAHIEIATNSPDPAYQKLIVPVQLISPRPGAQMGKIEGARPSAAGGSGGAPATQPAPTRQ
jgi:hypothetical protein